MEKHNINCMICGEELVYSSENRELECIYCGGIYESNTSCKSGHYVCDICHSKEGIDIIYDYCLKTDKNNPIEMAIELMKNSNINMHGPEHHFLVPAVLLASYYNILKQGDDRAKKLRIARERAKQIPGGICGNYGNCGAGVGAGLFISIILGATPLTEESWGLANEMTGNVLIKAGKIGGPRCCKRNSFLAIEEASRFIDKKLGVKLYEYDKYKTICEFRRFNKECIGRRCAYFYCPET